MLTPLGKKLGFVFLLTLILIVAIFAQVNQATALREDGDGTTEVHPDTGSRAVHPDTGKPVANLQLPIVTSTVINGKFQITGYKLKTVFSEQTGFLFTCLVPENYDEVGGKISCQLGEPNHMSENTLEAVQAVIQKKEIELGGVFPNQAIQLDEVKK